MSKMEIVTWIIKIFTLALAVTASFMSDDLATKLLAIALIWHDVLNELEKEDD